MEEVTGLTAKQLTKKFPELETTCYSLPTTHFNEHNLKRMSVEERQAQKLYTAVEPRESHIRGSEAQQRVLSSFQNIDIYTRNNPMFILSEVNFGNILRGINTKTKIKKGEADLIIIDKKLGLIVIEIKSVDEDIDDNRLNCVLEKCYKVCKSSKGLTDKEIFVQRLLEALGQEYIHVTYVVAVPNISRCRLSRKDIRSDYLKVINGRKQDGVHREEKPPLDLLYLCKEEFPPRFKHQNYAHLQASAVKLQKWLEKLACVRDTLQEMSLDDYYKLVAAFVGPRSQINVWSQKDKEMTSTGRCMHTQDDVIHEVGTRFQKAVFTDEMKQIYDKESDLKHVYLTGHPAGGITMLLTQLAEKWLRGGKFIVIFSMAWEHATGRDRLVAWEMKNMLASSRRSDVRLLAGCDLKNPIDIIQKVYRLRKRNPSRTERTVFLLPGISTDKSRQVAKLLRKEFPEASVWTSGKMSSDIPCKFTMMELSKPVRCPPTIQQVMQDIDDTLHENSKYSHYTCSTLQDCFLPADGPPAQWFSHQGHNGYIRDCLECGRTLGHYLKKEIHVGSRDGRLKFSDIIIVTNGRGLERSKFLKGLKGKGVNTEMWGERKAGPPLDNNVLLVADVSLVWGVEKMVVVFVPDGDGDGEGVPQTPTDATGVDTNTGMEECYHMKRLRKMGPENCRALRKAASCSLAQAVIFHFGHDGGLLQGQQLCNSADPVCVSEVTTNCSVESSKAEQQQRFQLGVVHYFGFCFVICVFFGFFFLVYRGRK